MVPVLILGTTLASVIPDSESWVSIPCPGLTGGLRALFLRSYGHLCGSVLLVATGALVRRDPWPSSNVAPFTKAVSPT